LEDILVLGKRDDYVPCLLLMWFMES